MEERIVNDFDFEPEMIANGMENAPSLHLRRIGCDFIVIILQNFGVDIIAIELLCLLGLDEDQVQKIHKAGIELLHEIFAPHLHLVGHLVKCFEEITLASSSNHFSLEDAFVEL